MISLPDPSGQKGKLLTRVMALRKSTRRFSRKELTLGWISYILWACQGRSDMTAASGRRTVPSAGATYPLEAFLVCGDKCVSDLGAGVYHYLSDRHGLEQRSCGDVRHDLARACFSQRFIAEAPASLVIAADYARTGMTYGQRAMRYVHIEVGHAAQNVYLACEAIGLATVAVGAFSDEDVSRTLGLPTRVEPVYVMPIGLAK